MAYFNKRTVLYSTKNRRISRAYVAKFWKFLYEFCAENHRNWKFAENDTWSEYVYVVDREVDEAFRSVSETSSENCSVFVKSNSRSTPFRQLFLYNQSSIKLKRNTVRKKKLCNLLLQNLPSS